MVTIVTVCRNAEMTIAHTLKSVMEQDYTNLEYIVIDGKSSDGTLEKVKNCPAVSRWLSETDEGIADAFNKGVSLAKGEWVGIINADDWYEPGAVSAIMEEAEKADVIHGPVQYWSEDIPKEIYYPKQEMLHREMTINHPSVFIRKSVYEAVGGFDVTYKYAMDYELLLRIHSAGYRFREVTGHVVANMRFGGASDLHWRSAIREVLRAKNTHFPSCKWHNRGYYFLQFIRGSLRRVLERMGMRGLVRHIRWRWSIMRKQ